jgi:hypothetical protein
MFKNICPLDKAIRVHEKLSCILRDDVPPDSKKVPLALKFAEDAIRESRALATSSIIVSDLDEVYEKCREEVETKHGELPEISLTKTAAWSNIGYVQALQDYMTTSREILKLENHGYDYLDNRDLREHMDWVNAGLRKTFNEAVAASIDYPEKSETIGEAGKKINEYNY